MATAQETTFLAAFATFSADSGAVIAALQALPGHGTGANEANQATGVVLGALAQLNAFAARLA